MIELFYDATPNGRKALIAREEAGLPYVVRWVDVKRGDQFSPEYLLVNPNAKIPAIIDTEGPGGRPISIFESGAILIYLAEKTGKLIPADPRERWAAICWTTWQVANQGPASGNASHFMRYAPAAGIDDEYAKARYVGETRRCAALLDGRLADRTFIVGEEFTIADIACFPWTRVMKAYDIDLHEYPHLAEWSDRISARPSARVKLERPADLQPPVEQLTGAEYQRLFGVDPRTVPVSK